MDRFLYRREKPFPLKILLSPLYPLSLLYGCAVRLRAAAYTARLFKTNRLPCPVVSVGNITVGGTGKTPLVIALASRLKERDIPVAVLSRGYKGSSTSGPVVSDGETIHLSPEEAGDEAYLMAERLRGLPVLVGKDRFTNGRIALQRYGIRGILLDDGFQHFPLHRDLNIVLVDSTIGFGDRYLLPRGILREPLTHLRRASLFLLTKVEDPGACRPLEDLLRMLHPEAPVFHSSYEASGLVGPRGEWDEISSSQGRKVVALSGIANPSPFLSLLKKCGMRVIKEVIFPDHHPYTRQDLVSIEKRANGADWIVTTEKDLVRLARLETGGLPIRALRINMRLWEEGFFQEVVRLFYEGEDRR
jgi:tetraacyldisaccharide 4'-kinase